MDLRLADRCMLIIELALVIQLYIQLPDTRIPVQDQVRIRRVHLYGIIKFSSGGIRGHSIGLADPELCINSLKIPVGPAGNFMIPYRCTRRIRTWSCTG